MSNLENLFSLNKNSSKLWLIPNALHNGYEELPSDCQQLNKQI